MLGRFLEEKNRKEGEKEERRSINIIVLKKAGTFFFGILFKIRNLWSGNIWYLRNGRIFSAKLQEEKSSSPNNGGWEGFLKPALDGLHPQGAWSHQRMTSLAPTFFFIFIHLLATNFTASSKDLSVPQRCSYTSNSLPSQYGGRGHTHRGDRQTGVCVWGGGVVLHTATIRSKVSPARTLGPGNCWNNVQVANAGHLISFVWTQFPRSN